MYLAYKVDGKLISLCRIDKSKCYGYDIRNWFIVDGAKVIINRKIDKKLESFELCNPDVHFESVKKSMLEEIE